jgi:hypothetical protein
MKRMRIVGLALVAMFALVAITAASASATPTYKECAKEKPGGKFEKGCTKEGGKGGYALKVGVGKKPASKSKGGAANLVVVVPAGVSKEFPEGATIHIECATNKGVSTSKAPNLVEKAVTAFKKCKVLGAPCQSGAKKEEIVTNSLSGELVDIEGGEGVGTVLHAEPPGTASAAFACTEVAETNVIGSLIGVNVGNINKFSKTSELVFTTGPGLGEVEYAPGKKYTPLVNVPTHKTGGPNGEHFLLSEISKENTKKEKEKQGTLPSGQTQTVEVKGENLEITP